MFVDDEIKIDLTNETEIDKFVSTLLDRSARKDFQITLAERTAMLEVLKAKPDALKCKAPRVVFAPSKHRPDLNDYDRAPD